MQFDALPLHDATLSTIHVSYEAARCDLVLNIVGGQACQLGFEGFRGLALPKREPWGRSHSVNAVRQVDAHVYEVELQSGDLLRIEAEQWSFSLAESINLGA